MQRNLYRLPGGGISSSNNNNNSTELRSSLLKMSNRPYDGKIAGMYDLEETLGRGHFAVVKLARHVFTGQKVAVKVIDKSKLDDVSKAHLFQEVRCMKLVQHPNVVRLYQVIDTATKLYLVLELGDGGDLYEYIIKHEQGLPEDMAKDYFRQIVRAISYCHQLHVVHRDLKPENVVFFKKLGVVKLTDFGFSNRFYPGQKLETSCGSLAYSAPEILLGDSYDAPAVDVWSLGVILYMLVCGQAPFQEANDSETLTMIMDCKYNVPSHVSDECRELISRMLVKNPENRATLKEISTHRWLTDGSESNSTDTLALPLVSREHLNEEDHNLIVQKMVNGNIATKEDIQDCLDKNEYNHITATYYLLAEMKLKSKRLDLVNKHKRPENLSVSNSLASPKRENGTTLKPCLLNVPRTPGDLPQRSRKCSIVQEDEEEEDVCPGREDLGSGLNRRGSRSEGRLNLALQDRLSETDRRKPSEKVVHESVQEKSSSGVRQKVPNIIWQNNKRLNASKETKTTQSDIIPTTIITDCSTIASPITRINDPVDCSAMPKYKTMPSPTRNSTSSNPLQLNEIFEENVDINNHSNNTTPPQSSSSRFIKRTPYEQRKSKFHKSRTTSCSSSDASDDDSEKRKKRQNKLNPAPSVKPFQGRRDSHDDSSDSQDPSSSTGSERGYHNKTGGGGIVVTGGGGDKSNETMRSQNGGGGGARDNDKTTSSNENPTTTSGSNSKPEMNTGSANTINPRPHKLNRRRTDETRLRESQSLNRITEVQEDNTHALVISATTVVSAQNAFTPKMKGLGARILQSFSISPRKQEQVDDNVEKILCKNNTTPVSRHISRKDTLKADKQDTSLVTDKKKLKILGKYFQVHKKLCIPLPVIFQKNNNNNNRLYKAQSCGSLVRDKISKREPVLRCRQRAVSVFRNSLGGIEEDINRNAPNDKRRKSATVVQLNNVCNELTGICAIHLGQTTKCSFC